MLDGINQTNISLLDGKATICFVSKHFWPSQRCLDKQRQLFFVCTTTSSYLMMMSFWITCEKLGLSLPFIFHLNLKSNQLNKHTTTPAYLMMMSCWITVFFSNNYLLSCSLQKLLFLCMYLYFFGVSIFIDNSVNRINTAYQISCYLIFLNKGSCKYRFRFLANHTFFSEIHVCPQKFSRARILKRDVLRLT